MKPKQLRAGLHVCKRLRELDELLHASMHRRFGQRRTAFFAELAQRERRVPESQLGELLQATVERRKLSFVSQLANRRYLQVRSPTGANEVRVIRIRESIRL